MCFCKPAANRYICFSYKPFYMKRFSPFLFILSVLFVTNVKAQFSKGTRMVGASVASLFFNSGTSDQTITFIGSTTGKVTGYGVNITPSLGWFISDNTAIGFALALSPNGEKVTFEENGSTFQKDKFTNFNVGIGGFARNYFRSSGSFLPFGQAGFDAGISSRKTDGFFYGGSAPATYKKSYNGKSSGGFFADLFLTLGVTKKLNEYTGLDLYVGYNYAYNKNTMNLTTLRDDLIDGTIDETAKSETVTKYTNHRFILGVGFQVFLEKRKK